MISGFSCVAAFVNSRQIREKLANGVGPRGADTSTRRAYALVAYLYFLPSASLPSVAGSTITSGPFVLPEVIALLGMVS